MSKTSEINEKRRARLSAVEIIFICVGVLVIGLGIYGLIRPNLVMPAKRETLQIAGQRVVMETRRIVPIPRPLGALIVVCGGGLILLGVPKRQR